MPILTISSRSFSTISEALQRNSRVAAMAHFLQARPPLWWPHQWRTVAADTATFYCAKSRQGLPSHGGPVSTDIYHWGKLKRLDFSRLFLFILWHYSLLKNWVFCHQLVFTLPNEKNLSIYIKAVFHRKLWSQSIRIVYFVIL